MTEQMTKKLADAAKGLQLSNGQMLLDKETLKLADLSTPLERLVYVPIPEKIESAMWFGAYWYRDNVWHDIKEEPVYREDDHYHNQILVYGQSSAGKGFSVCCMIDNGIIYSCVTEKEYDWSKCKFEQWAYIEDFVPTPMKELNELCNTQTNTPCEW
mgnify:CR=1 FL=1